ncbi:hypothetical protein FHX15_005179 [Rhizobium sp. BK650]|uniref:hypothetical protein n=1 Tax=Rhizobium sp. BK650 TaxID=2586990 RepID=UPI00160B2BE4|nr:hypothetical protein [Rhizobium sp. BK650]MBB3659910.1 hypothetical protein [Rhizobium sp. BK650]
MQIMLRHAVRIEESSWHQRKTSVTRFRIFIAASIKHKNIPSGLAAWNADRAVARYRKLCKEARFRIDKEPIAGRQNTGQTGRCHHIQATAALS